MPGNAVGSVAGAPRPVPPIMHYRWLQRPIIDGGGVAVEHSDDADPPGDMRLISASANGPSTSISRTEWFPAQHRSLRPKDPRTERRADSVRCCSGSTGMQNRCQVLCMLFAIDRFRDLMLLLRWAALFSRHTLSGGAGHRWEELEDRMEGHEASQQSASGQSLHLEPSE